MAKSQQAPASSAATNTGTPEITPAPGENQTPNGLEQAPASSAATNTGTPEVVAAVAPEGMVRARLTAESPCGALGVPVNDGSHVVNITMTVSDFIPEAEFDRLVDEYKLEIVTD